jgi:hypothetical protein
MTHTPMNYQFGKILLIAFGVAGVVAHAADPITIDLKQAAAGVGMTIVGDGALRWDADAHGRPALFTRNVIWLDGVNFTDGTIECDVLGKSLPRGSNFPGFVFRGADAATFDSVYFRPFNFRAENPENASHAVQYTSLPQWTWQKLRAERTGQYEKPIAPSLDGDAWFHAKIVLLGRKVTVFVNDAARPCLEVETLHDRLGGRVGISGGDAGDGGYFANLRNYAAPQLNETVPQMPRARGASED